MLSYNVTCPSLDEFKSLKYTGPLVTPDPDVAGIGVLVGFAVSSYLTLRLVCIYYLRGCVKEDHLNAFDKGILRTLWRKAHFEPSEEWEPALRNAVLMFSDQQLVTGIALLASGYSQLPCGLSSYHWQIIVYLAWFSSSAHLTTLTALRQYFRNNPALRWWRAILMLVTVIMLVVALLPTGNGWWLQHFSNKTVGVPALCYFKQLTPGGGFARSMQTSIIQLPPMLISILGLFFGFLTRLIKLSSQATAKTRLWIRTKPGKYIKKISDNAHCRSSLSNTGILWISAHIVLETVYVILLATFDIYESILGEILWLCFALAWGTAHLFVARYSDANGSYSSPNTDVMSQQNNWAFGQWLPVILLLLPIFSIGESLYEAKHSIETVRTTPVKSGGGSSQNVSRSTTIDDSLVLKIGYWTSTDVVGRENDETNIEPQQLRRTVTDLHREECIIGTASVGRPHTLPLSGSSGNQIQPTMSSHMETSSNTSPGTGTQPISHSRDYYRLEWFWVLESMILILACEIATFSIQSSVRIGVVEAAVPIIQYGLLFSVGLTLLYTGVFVFLTNFNKPIGIFLTKHLHLSHGFQTRCLRYCAYIYFLACIIAQFGFLLPLLSFF